MSFLKKSFTIGVLVVYLFSSFQFSTITAAYSLENQDQYPSKLLDVKASDLQLDPNGAKVIVRYNDRATEPDDEADTAVWKGGKDTPITQYTASDMPIEHNSVHQGDRGGHKFKQAYIFDKNGKKYYISSYYKMTGTVNGKTVNRWYITLRNNMVAEESNTVRSLSVASNEFEKVLIYKDEQPKVYFMYSNEIEQINIKYTVQPTAGVNPNDVVAEGVDTFGVKRQGSDENPKLNDFYFRITYPRYFEVTPKSYVNGHEVPLKINRIMNRSQGDHNIIEYSVSVKSEVLAGSKDLEIRMFPKLPDSNRPYDVSIVGNLLANVNGDSFIAGNPQALQKLDKYSPNNAYYFDKTHEKVALDGTVTFDINMAGSSFMLKNGVESSDIWNLKLGTLLINGEPINVPQLNFNGFEFGFSGVNTSKYIVRASQGPMAGKTYPEALEDLANNPKWYVNGQKSVITNFTRPGVNNGLKVTVTLKGFQMPNTGPANYVWMVNHPSIANEFTSANGFGELILPQYEVKLEHVKQDIAIDGAIIPTSQATAFVYYDGSTDNKKLNDNAIKNNIAGYLILDADGDRIVVNNELAAKWYGSDKVNGMGFLYSKFGTPNPIGGSRKFFLLNYYVPKGYTFEIPETNYKINNSGTDDWEGAYVRSGEDLFSFRSPIAPDGHTIYPPSNWAHMNEPTYGNLSDKQNESLSMMVVDKEHQGAGSAKIPHTGYLLDWQVPTSPAHAYNVARRTYRLFNGLTSFINIRSERKFYPLAIDITDPEVKLSESARASLTSELYDVDYRNVINIPYEEPKKGNLAFLKWHLKIEKTDAQGVKVVKEADVYPGDQINISELPLNNEYGAGAPKQLAEYISKISLEPSFSEPAETYEDFSIISAVEDEGKVGQILNPNEKHHFKGIIGWNAELADDAPVIKNEITDIQGQKYKFTNKVLYRSELNQDNNQIAVLYKTDKVDVSFEVDPNYLWFYDRDLGTLNFKVDANTSLRDAGIQVPDVASHVIQQFFVFDGWYDKDDPEHRLLTPQQVETMKQTKNTVFVAKFSKNTVPITGVAAAPTNLVVILGASLALLSVIWVVAKVRKRNS